MKIHKEYDGSECDRCKELSQQQDITQEDIDKEHFSCHGWYHCGEGCCGVCRHCGY